MEIEELSCRADIYSYVTDHVTEQIRNPYT
jgi:hypothetical protein